jgi:hypothetical protein
MAGLFTRIGAHLLRSTLLIDRVYQRFDSLRSLSVLAFASDGFLTAYGRIAFDAADSYRAGSSMFRTGLFGWEERAIREFFPRAPARVLIGGAGGGREAFALVGNGYDVVAFDPAPALAASMCTAASTLRAGSLNAYCAAYADLPYLPPTGQSPGCDLTAGPPFDAAILGWTSFSHLSTDDERIDALRRVGRLVCGPILVSYFGRSGGGGPARSSGAFAGLRRRAERRGSAMFTPAIGYARLLTEREFRDLATRADLRVVHLDRDGEFPFAILSSP